MQRVAFQRSGEHSPVSNTRQSSVFPPNYVHLIDSAHMLLTAIACQRQGLPFAAVHDSFWTCAAHVGVMNSTLRDEFVRLHERELLRELRDGFVLRYGASGVRLPEVPEHGELDLRVVRDSPNFFS